MHAGAMPAQSHQLLPVHWRHEPHYVIEFPCFLSLAKAAMCIIWRALWTSRSALWQRSIGCFALHPPLQPIYVFQVSESPETYAEVTLPYIKSIPAARMQWVYNILERKALRSSPKAHTLQT